MSRSKILFALSGSIAAYKACQVLSALVQAGHDVQTLCTPNTLNFVGTATLEGLSGKPVLSDTFQEGRQMDHIHLVDEVDFALLCPASADCLNRLAAGMGDNLLLSLFLAWDWSKPFYIAPAMNTRMWEHPATQASLKTLESWGARIIAPGSGTLACGTSGAGRLAEVDVILEQLQRPKGKQVLITGGGTRQPIDGVRELGNRSSGRTTRTLAKILAKKGHEVTFLHSDSITPPDGVRGVPFRSFEDLDAQLSRELGNTKFDAVIHGAAVSDYGIKQLLIDGKPSLPDPEAKIPSSSSLSLELEKKPKILSKLRDYSCSPETQIVAFKLTQNASEETREAAVAKVLKLADVVVHNDLSEISHDAHPAAIYLQDRRGPSCQTKQELAEQLHHILEQTP